MSALEDAIEHLRDDGALRWTVGSREEYLERSHKLLVAIVKDISPVVGVTT